MVFVGLLSSLTGYFKGFFCGCLLSIVVSVEVSFNSECFLWGNEGWGWGGGVIHLLVASSSCGFVLVSIS